MKFHPHPPSQAGLSTPLSRKRHSHINRTPNSRSRSPNRLPLSQEESSLPDMHHWSLPSPEDVGACAMLPRDSGVYSAAGRADDDACLCRKMSVVVDEANTDLGVRDKVARDDILRGLEYLEGRNERSRDTIARIRTELERVMGANRALENINMRLENDLLMQQHGFDTMWKENERLKEQALEQWTARVKADEMHAETRRDMQLEVRQLRAQVTSTRHGERGAAESESRQDEVRQLAEEKSGFLLKINQMEGEIAKFVSGKRDAEDLNSSLQEETSSLKVSLEEVKTELSNQLQRFVALKRSYRKLFEENETFKSQLRGRASLANETWPVRSNTKKAPGCEDSERVNLINLKFVDRNKQRVAAAVGHLSLPKAESPKALVSPGRKLPPVQQ